MPRGAEGGPAAPAGRPGSAACHNDPPTSTSTKNPTRTLTPNPQQQVYDAKRFTDGGLRHHELYFPDGSCPPTELLLRFLEIAEAVRVDLGPI